MNRYVATLLLACGLLSGPNLTRADDGTSVPLDEEYKGKTKAPAKKSDFQKFTLDTVEIDLKSGQRVEFQVKVTGDRSVAVILHNGDGDLVGASWPTPKLVGNGFGGQTALDWKLERLGTNRDYIAKLSPKTVRYPLPEAPATGTYKLTVIADIAGDYTLLARDVSKKRDAATVRKELEAAKRLVADLENELKTLEKK